MEYNTRGGSCGERYLVSFRHSNGTVITVRFWNFLYRKSKYPGIYIGMLDDIRRYYIDSMIRERLRRFNSNEVVEIGRLLMDLENITLAGAGLLFAWNDLAIEFHERYFMLIRTGAPEFKFKMMFGEWYSEITYQFIRRVLAARG
ncbi:MAG: hypothetical protein WDN75_14510 [Bacteroidota bacterium]